MPHILIICTANICRSPVGEVVLRDRLQKQGLQDWTVASAGTWGADGRSASMHSITLMAEQGFDLKGHLARTITQNMLREAHLALCMELGHVEALKAEFPQYQDKVFLLSDMIGKKYSISDPYGGSLTGYESMVKEVTNLIDAGLECIISLTERSR